MRKHDSVHNICFPLASPEVSICIYVHTHALHFSITCSEFLILPIIMGAGKNERRTRFLVASSSLIGINWIIISNCSVLQGGSLSQGLTHPLPRCGEKHSVFLAMEERPGDTFSSGCCFSCPGHRCCCFQSAQGQRDSTSVLAVSPLQFLLPGTSASTASSEEAPLSHH